MLCLCVLAHSKIACEKCNRELLRAFLPMLSGKARFAVPFFIKKRKNAIMLLLAAFSITNQVNILISEIEAQFRNEKVYFMSLHYSKTLVLSNRTSICFFLTFNLLNRPLANDDLSGWNHWAFSICEERSN